MRKHRHQWSGAHAAETGGKHNKHTSYDFPYLVCVSDDTVMVFSDVKAGETITIDGKSKKATAVPADFLF